MMSRTETERLKRCYLKRIRESGVLPNVLPSLAEIPAQEIADATVGMLDEATRDEALRRQTDPDLSICREVLMKEIGRLRREGAGQERR